MTQANSIGAVVPIVTLTVAVPSSLPGGADGDDQDEDEDEAAKSEADTKTEGEP
jgi:hypothetical protein